jgi:hypothetical protein
MACVQITNMQGLAVVGVRPRPQPGEVFVGGTLNPDTNKMVLSFKSPSHMRLVTCERQPYGDHTRWYPINQLVI